LLLTLILDDCDGQRNTYNWDIYYHVFLNQAFHDGLLQQAKKLHALAGSLEAWHASEYAKLVRFCDKSTLTRVAEVWAFYISAATEKQLWMKETFKAAIHVRNHHGGGKSPVTMTGLRSTTPVGSLAMTDVNDLHNHFWNHGSLHLDSAARSQATYANPMFVSADPAVRLHYGTDPLLGFHLSTAYVPLSGSPSARANGRKPKLEDVVAAARTEFFAWCDTFRKQASRCMTLRLFAGDVFPFCYTLQHRRVTGSATTAFCYRSRHNTMSPLVLLEDDYGSQGTAPVSFNVIDTSNLLDHLGGLNLLAAVSPLLDEDTPSCLYTETLARRGTRSQQTHLDELVGGHLATTSLLLGLFPVEYWTNTSPSSAGDEEIVTAFMANVGMSDTTQVMPTFTRVTWKRPPSCSGPRMEPLHMEDGELASLLHRIYIDMFPSEDIARMMANLNPGSLHRISLPTYTRPGFVALLQLIKGRVVTDWDAAMHRLASRIESDPSLIVGSNYMQELYLYMHLLGIHSVGTFRDFPGFRMRMGIEPNKAFGLPGWKDLPSSVCITLKVPRSALGAFTDRDSTFVGTLPVQAVVSGSGSGRFSAWQNAFAAFQLGFGKLSTAGSRFSNSFTLKVDEDSQAWHGTTPPRGTCL
jgi:hypothetical protein